MNPFQSGLIFLSLGVESMDEDNVEVRVVGRYKHFDAFHRSDLPEK